MVVAVEAVAIVVVVVVVVVAADVIVYDAARGDDELILIPRDSRYASIIF